MVNKDGISSGTSVEEMELEEWEAVVETILDRVMHGTKAALPYLKASKDVITGANISIDGGWTAL